MARKKARSGQTRTTAQRKLRAERFYDIMAGSLHPLETIGLNRDLAVGFALPLITVSRTRKG